LPVLCLFASIFGLPDIEGTALGAGEAESQALRLGFVGTDIEGDTKGSDDCGMNLSGVDRSMIPWESQCNRSVCVRQ
jgi:hypothetical protein